MKMVWLFLVFCFGLISTGLCAEERVVSTLNKVDLISVDKQNKENHNYGTDYYAFNRNEFPVQVRIKVSDSKNTQDGLVSTPVIINPNERSYLGWLLQNDLGQEAKWNVQWEVVKP